jgi:hypothetical protein
MAKDAGQSSIIDELVDRIIEQLAKGGGLKEDPRSERWDRSIPLLDYARSVVRHSIESTVPTMVAFTLTARRKAADLRKARAALEKSLATLPTDAQALALQEIYRASHELEHYRLGRAHVRGYWCAYEARFLLLFFASADNLSCDQNAPFHSITLLIYQACTGTDKDMDMRRDCIAVLNGTAG